MLGDLFIVRGVCPSVLGRMKITELRYWHDWHKLSDKKEIKENKRLADLRNN